MSHALCTGNVFNKAFFETKHLLNTNTGTNPVPAKIGNCTSGVFNIQLPTNQHAAIIEFKNRTSPDAFMLSKFDMGTVSTNDAAMTLRSEMHKQGETNDKDSKLFANVFKNELVLSREGSSTSVRTSYNAGSGAKTYKFEVKSSEKFTELSANGVTIKYCENCASKSSSSTSSSGDDDGGIC